MESNNYKLNWKKRKRESAGIELHRKDSGNKKKRDSTSTSVARTVNLSVIPVASPTLRAEIHVDTQTRVRASAHFSSIQPPYKYRSVDGVIFQLPELTTRTVTETQPKTKHTQTNKNGAGTLPTE